MSDPSIDSSPGDGETAIPLPTIGEIVEPLSSKADLLAGKSASSRSQSERSFYRPIESTRRSLRKAPPLALPAIVAMVLIRQAKRVSWYNRSSNVDLAAVIVVLALACCTAYSDRGSFPPSDFSLSPKTAAVVHQVSLSPQKPASAESHSRLPVTRISARKVVRRSPQRHQAMAAGQRVVHIGEDVTVRYFAPMPMPHKAPAGAHQVVRKGEDVTVRYFAPVGHDAKDGPSVEAADRKRLGLAAGAASGLRASGTKTPE